MPKTCTIRFLRIGWVGSDSFRPLRQDSELVQIDCDLHRISFRHFRARSIPSTVETQSHAKIDRGLRPPRKHIAEHHLTVCQKLFALWVFVKVASREFYRCSRWTTSHSELAMFWLFDILFLNSTLSFRPSEFLSLPWLAPLSQFFQVLHRG